MSKAFFVTGTDTEVGKTHVSCLLLKQYAAQGLKVIGMKPIAAGCELVNGEWGNEDVQKLIAASNVTAPLDLINPYRFKEPIAPHLAAEKVGVTIEIETIVSAFKQLQTMADVVIVEGAGGFLVPLNTKANMADLAIALGLPTILVVGLRLGCINHSLLTVEAIKARGLALHGWVANHIDVEMEVQKENIQTIAKQLGVGAMLVSEWVG
ncbi:MAG: dethiobiotin synthase [Methylophilaceae bacterium]|nr:dethiobiotin synthase [Betaproteobacteria bacterium]MDG1097689.1 dethiobiotin synthase [Methylophilaceae bacterium]MDG1452921.1 dethiobiotin synthase [Methylophilaceae bacterium]